MYPRPRLPVDTSHHVPCFLVGDSITSSITSDSRLFCLYYSAAANLSIYTEQRDKPAVFPCVGRTKKMDVEVSAVQTSFGSQALVFHVLFFVEYEELVQFDRPKVTTGKTDSGGSSNTTSYRVQTFNSSSSSVESQS